MRQIIPNEWTIARAWDRHFVKQGLPWTAFLGFLIIECARDGWKTLEKPLPLREYSRAVPPLLSPRAR